MKQQTEQTERNQPQTQERVKMCVACFEDSDLKREDVILVNIFECDEEQRRGVKG